jgi:SPP1 gp7 family putative phage head morphogenesis protein
MTPDAVATRTLPAALRAVRAARRRVIAVARENPDADPWALVARCRAELAKLEPTLARLLAGATLAGWVLAARRPARDAAPVTLPDPPRLPPPPSEIRPTSSDESGRPVVFPLVDAAVRDLMSREVVTRQQYDALEGQAKAAAFTVARVVTTDAIERVRDAVAETVAQGKTLKQFRREVGPAIDGALSESQVEAVFRTAVGQSQAAGVRAALEVPAVADLFPYILYDAIRDSRTRPQHQWLAAHGLDGTGVYRADDPTIRRFHPPCGWNCRCVAVLLTVEDAAARGVREARAWLRDGRPPARPSWAPVPPFSLPKGWPDPAAGIRAVVA